MEDTLIYGLATLFVGLVGLLIKIGFKSKCSDVSVCCGLLRVQRDTESELKEEKMELEFGKKSMSINNLSSSV